MLRLRDIKKGDRFYEKNYGITVLVEALEDARRIKEQRRNGHVCRVRVVKGTALLADADGICEFFEALEPGAYGLIIWREKELQG